MCICDKAVRSCLDTMRRAIVCMRAGPCAGHMSAADTSASRAFPATLCGACFRPFTNLPLLPSAFQKPLQTAGQGSGIIGVGDLGVWGSWAVGAWHPWRAGEVAREGQNRTAREPQMLKGQRTRLNRCVLSGCVPSIRAARQVARRAPWGGPGRSLRQLCSRAFCPVREREARHALSNYYLFLDAQIFNRGPYQLLHLPLASFPRGCPTAAAHRRQGLS